MTNSNRQELRVHAFDLDNTLVPGSLVERAFSVLVNQGRLNLSDEEVAKIIEYKTAGNHSEYIREVVAGFSEGIKGLSIKGLRKTARALAEQDRERIFPEIEEVLYEIRSHNEEIVILSGSPRIFVEAFGRSIGARVADGTHHYVARGRIHETRPRAKAIWEKDKHLKSICESIGGVAVSAYGDTMNDYPMLLMVPQPVAVNPLPSLREKALEHRWPIIDCENFDIETQTYTSSRSATFPLQASPLVYNRE